MTVKSMPWADEKIKADYPGMNMSDEDKRRIDDRSITVEELLTRPDRADLIIYSMGQALSYLLTSLLKKYAEKMGEQAALDLAYEYGREHGALQYGSFLKARNSKGGVKIFCEYQDFGHALRGPRHSGALFATHDDNTVYLKRNDCLYYWGNRNEPNKFVQRFEDGVVDGYRDVDPSLGEMDTPCCLALGNSSEGCERVFHFKE